MADDLLVLGAFIVGFIHFGVVVAGIIYASKPTRKKKVRHKRDPPTLPDLLNE